MDAYCFRTHKLDSGVIWALENLCASVDNVHVLYDATDKPEFPVGIKGLNYKVFNFTADDYINSGYPIATEEQIYALPTPPPRGSRSGIIYYNPEYAQLLFWKQHKCEFEHIWYIEYDVAFLGKWNEFFSRYSDAQADLLGAYINRYPFKPTWDKLWEQIFFDVKDEQKLSLFGCIWRGSNKLFEILDREYSEDNHAYYELAVPTLAAKNGLHVTDLNIVPSTYNAYTLGGQFITRYWSKELINNSGNMLFHPVIYTGE